MSFFSRRPITYISRHFVLTYVDLNTQTTTYAAAVRQNSCMPVLHLATHVACGSGGDVTCKWPDDATYKNALDNIGTVTKMLEFTTKAGITDNIATVVSQGTWNVVGYNCEAGFEPADPDPLQSMKDAAASVRSNGLEFYGVPSKAYTDSFGTSIAPYCNYFHIQTQGLQDDLATLKTYIGPTVAALRKANPALQFITAQVSTQQPVAAGLTMQQTLRTASEICLAYVDGMACFFGNTSVHTPDPIGEMQSWATWYKANYLKDGL